MPRGGARKGAGRKAGGLNQKTVERLKLAEQAAAGGVTPLDVLLQTMRELWAENTKEARLAACKIADQAAPYVHPRLATQTLSAELTQKFAFELPLTPLGEDEWLGRINPPPMQ